jgi:hypothetical protein
LKFKVEWQILFFAVIVGCCIGFVSGLVERKPEFVTVPENKYYGAPFIWRSTDPFVGEKYHYLELFLDCIFWITITFIAIVVAKKLAKS